MQFLIEYMNAITIVLIWAFAILMFVLFIKGGVILDDTPHNKFDEN